MRHRIAFWAYKTQLCLLVLAFCGCAETRLYQDGHLVAVMQADATNVTVRSHDVYYHADVQTHSTATKAAYKGINGTIGGIISAIVTAFTDIFGLAP